LNLPLDLDLVGANVRPGIGEVFRPKRGVASQKVRLADAKSPGLLQRPDGNARARDARLASANAGPTLDTGEGVAQLARDRLQELRFLRLSERWQKFLGFLKCGHGSVLKPFYRFGNGEDSGRASPNANGMIRLLNFADPPVFEEAFAAQGWNKPAAQFERYFFEQESGARTVLVAELDDKLAGYVTIVWKSGYAPFREESVPEICDFNVLKKFWRRGVGTALMDEAESRIAERSPVAGIGVGLTADYGAAQILYVKRGYVPDGRGIEHDGRSLFYGDSAPVDDGLVLHLTKRLRPL
jgi:GNAT superfamily N-acetyltransferase